MSPSGSSANESSQNAAPTIVFGSIPTMSKGCSPGRSAPAYFNRVARVTGSGKSPGGGASWSTQIWTSLPTKTPAFASTVARSERTIVCAFTNTPRQSAAAETSRTVSRGRLVIRWTARYATGEERPSFGPDRRSASTASRAPSAANPATNSTGKASRNALGRVMSSRTSLMSAPPACSRLSTQSAPAIANSSQGTHASRRLSECTSNVRRNDTPETTPRTNSPAAPAAAAAVNEDVRADAAVGAAGPNTEMSHDPRPRPAAAPNATGMAASSVDLAANRTGPHPRACRSAASVRRPATANAAAAATTAAATPSPAMSRSRSGPSTVAERRSTSRITSPIAERNSVSRRPKKGPRTKSLPQHRNSRPTVVRRSVT